MEQFRQDQQITHPMTFDELSMERSKSFIKALQELKNLRPQLYSAAEYCEKSYLHSEQKQMVLDNLKDYAMRAVVNAVDHLGTVAYKLEDLLERQASDVSTMELKVTCMNQQLFTCRTYTDNEGLRQQQLLAIIPRHHKHYILPNSLNKKVHFSPQCKNDYRQSPVRPRSGLPSGVPAAKTLSWHLASETKSTLKTQPCPLRSEDPRAYGKTSEAFQFPYAEDGVQMKSPAADLHLSGGGHVDMQAYGATGRVISYSGPSEGSKPLSRPEISPAAVRSKNVLSTFFVKQKARRKLKLAS